MDLQPECSGRGRSPSQARRQQQVKPLILDEYAMTRGELSASATVVWQWTHLQGEMV